MKGLFAALEAEGGVRSDANMRAGQWATVGCAFATPLAATADAMIGTLAVAAVTFSYFTLGRIGPPRVRRALRRYTGLFALMIPPSLIIVVSETITPVTGLTFAVPSVIAVLFIGMSMLRFEPWRPFAYGVATALLHFIAWAIVTRGMSIASLRTNAALDIVEQFIRVISYIGVGVAMAMVARAMRAALLRAASRVRANDLFGKYRLGAPIAAGGMATVVDATYCPEGGFERPVAIKRLHPHLVKHERIVQGFRAEAELGARLAHPNIVSVLDFGCVDDTYFIAMERVVGTDLKTLLRALRKQKLRMPPPLCAYLAHEMLQGLSFAHEGARDSDGRLLHVVHRDLSPANVLVSRTGEVKLTDFGIATALREGDRHETRHIIGSIPYLSPEQAQQLPFDHRADLFAVGVQLYEMLAGKRLFKRDSDANTLLAIITEDAPPLKRAWDPFFARALAKDPAQRFSSAREMRAALEDVLVSLGEELPRADDLAALVAASGALKEPEPTSPEEEEMDAVTEPFREPGVFTTTMPAREVNAAEVSEDIASRPTMLLAKGPTKEPTKGPTKGPTKEQTKGPTKGAAKAPMKGPASGPTEGAEAGAATGAAATGAATGAARTGAARTGAATTGAATTGAGTTGAATTGAATTGAATTGAATGVATGTATEAAKATAKRSAKAA